MDTEGTFDPRSTRHNPLPPPPPQSPPSFPTAPPPVPPTAPPAAPGAPVPAQAPGAPPAPGPAARPSFVAWLRAPRSEAAPGVWTYEHKPKAPEEPDRIPGRRLLSGALISLLCGWLVWSLLWNGYLGGYWLWPLALLTPDSWSESGNVAYVVATYTYYGIFLCAIAVIFGRVGHWSEVWARYVAPLFRRAWDEPAPEAAVAMRPEGIPWSGRTCGPRGRTVRLIGWRRTHGRGR